MEAAADRRREVELLRQQLGDSEAVLQGQRGESSRQLAQSHTWSSYMVACWSLWMCFALQVHFMMTTPAPPAFPALHLDCQSSHGGSSTLS